MTPKNSGQGFTLSIESVELLNFPLSLDLQTFARKIKIALSDGHGYLTSGKRTPDGYRENYFNEKVVAYLKAELIRCGFDVLLVAPTTADTSLKARTDAANKWGADAYVSVHYNALKSSWRTGEGGIETFHYPGSKTGNALATAIHNELIKGTPLRNRGVKSANLHEVRETNMPAALAECGFMDIKREAELMKSPAYQKECAVEIAKGVCNYFKVKYVPEKTSSGSAPSGSHIGTFTVGVDKLNLRDKPSLNSKIVDVLEQGQTFRVYGIEGYWLNLGGGKWVSNSGNKYGKFVKFEQPKPKPKPTPKPVEQSDTLYRVWVDGVKVGAFADDSNIIAQVETAIEKGETNVKLEKVK